ncbi:hypothetical protein [Paenibacillus sp. SN-8-1]|uniref:hypothetical protein n=1 Tax=Paenibacillus sp. SN-8-1 TaxID=3435409 RepID=UPI003D9AA480
MTIAISTIDIGALSQQVIEATLLLFRDDGSEIREALLPLILSAEHDVVALDFSHVQAIDFSCSDEIIVHVHENIALLQGKRIVLTNLSSNHKENIGSALDKKKQAVWVKEPEKAFILGDKLPKHLVELATLLHQKGRATARQLADEYEEEITNFSVKLKKLYEHGLATRFEEKSSEGMQYVYATPI